jgi:hypothetical protein
MSTMNIAQYSTAYSTYSTKTAFNTALLKKEMDSAANSITGTVSEAMDKTVDSINKVESTNPLSSSNVIDINI